MQLRKFKKDGCATQSSGWVCFDCSFDYYVTETDFKSLSDNPINYLDFYGAIFDDVLFKEELVWTETLINLINNLNASTYLRFVS